MTLTDISTMLDQFENVCFSGGAAGADRLFGLWAASNGHEEVHFSFKGHKSHVPPETVLELPIDLLTSTEIVQKLKTANKTLERSVPKFGYVYYLLARNSMQIYSSERLYTMGILVSPSQLDGGTAWAVQMYLDQESENKEIYHYDIVDKKIYSYDNILKQFIEVQSVPKPHGKWTGIGSRKATEDDMISFSSKFE
ncbi:hypothetical protein [Yersinia phage fHe-Yen9-04]|uniref:Uncharacterized protein n=2 Tax=Eneladusvirus Yen904 TaxID=2560849 RepID=A0A2C9CXE0_9CAUD|nr:DprA-like DNA recombination-mediator protein [Yersinia phage fHe-Yen9-04]SOK58490.1 hypothetical protein [Yersinia phage fHe-Yen9-04]SOK59025.1 hypothetical protein [Yersinia phage fHe-Yen9-03]VUE36259.1 hypothetical protein [Yersinia phage fHe-Yen9-04]